MDDLPDEHRRGPRGGVTVRGAGEVQVVPDVVIAELATEARALDGNRALLLASEALARISASLRAAGVDSRSLRTGGTATWSDGAYVVTRMDLTVTLRDIDTAGDLLGDAVTAGGDEARAGSLRYAISDPTPSQASARELAFADAVLKATHWATLAGPLVGRGGLGPGGHGRRIADVRPRRVRAHGDVRPGRGRRAGRTRRRDRPLGVGRLTVRVLGTPRRLG